MKKLIITMLALAAGATVGYSQGVITIANYNSAFFISTNGSSIGEGTGVASEENVSAFRFDVLDSTVALPQSAANLFLLSNQELWTDSGVTGTSEFFFTEAAYWRPAMANLLQTGVPRQEPSIAPALQIGILLWVGRPIWEPPGRQLNSIWTIPAFWLV